MQQSSTQKTAPKRLADSALSIFTWSAFNYVVLLGTSIVIARVLGPSQFGLWSILLLVPSYAIAFARSMTDVASVYFVARREFDVATAATALFYISVVMWLFTAGIFFAGQSWLFDSALRHFVGSEWLVLVMLITVILDLVTMNYRYLMLAEEDSTSYTRHLVLKTTLGPISGAVGLLLLGPRLEVMVWSVVGGSVVASLYGIYIVHSKHGIQLSIDLSVIKHLVAYGSKLYVGSIFGFVGVFITSGLIAAHLAEESVAFFQVALSRALLLKLVATAISTILYPRLASFDGDVEKVSSVFSIASRVNLIISGAMAVLLIIFAHPIFELLYGSAYSTAATLFAILTVGVMFDILATPTLQLFVAMGKPQLSTLLTVVIVVPQAIVVSLIVPGGNLTLVAWVTVGFFTLGGLVRLVVASRLLGIGLGELVIPRRSDVVLITSRLQERVLGRFSK